MVGQLVGNYRIVSRLAEGGMGVIYLAEHRHMGRRAAVKFLLPELSKKQNIITRFFDEARAASHVDHPGIVQIFDCDYYAATGQAYLVMEFLQGATLRQHLTDRRGAIDEGWAIRVAPNTAPRLIVGNPAEYPPNTAPRLPEYRTEVDCWQPGRGRSETGACRCHDESFPAACTW